MKIATVLKDLGGAAKVARQIKTRSKRGHLTTAAVCMWKRVPAEHVNTIVELSGGKYQPHQLRPDIFRRAA